MEILVQGRCEDVSIIFNYLCWDVWIWWWFEFGDDLNLVMIWIRWFEFGDDLKESSLFDFFFYFSISYVSEAESIAFIFKMVCN